MRGEKGTRVEGRREGLGEWAEGGKKRKQKEWRGEKVYISLTLSISYTCIAVVT